MLTDYREIYQGEIFRKSHCIELENSLMDFFQQNLTMLNYQPVDPSKKIWRRDNKTVVVCLVDDISTCSENVDVPVAKLFDSNTVVITDNRVYSSTDYQVLTLPESFFGIYYYSPDKIDYTPNKRINFSINRIDVVRLSLFLELAKWYNDKNSIFHDDIVNFNCINHNSLSAIEEFEYQYQNMYSDVQELYSMEFQTLKKIIPYKNHNNTIEQSMVSSYVNMIVETYSGDEIIAVSEKIFRALVTPAPWTIYGAKYTIEFLKELRFDVLDDVIDHKYNYLNYDNIFGYDASKVSEYVYASCNTANELKLKNNQQLQQRCLLAANHNQALLKGMRSQWPQDFAQWWHRNVQYVA